MTQVQVRVEDPSNVYIDDSNFGAVVDTAVNNVGLASDIQIALQDWWQLKQNEFAAQLVTEKAAAVAAATQPLEAQIISLTQELEAYRNPPVAAQKWNELGSALLNSELFAKVRSLADQSISASNAYTDLGFALFATHREEGLMNALLNIRKELSRIEADFSPEELEILDRSLQENGFSALV